VVVNEDFSSSRVHTFGIVEGTGLVYERGTPLA